MLYDEAMRAKVPVSLATVYNTLNQFVAAGLMKRITLDTDRTYFDTNTGNHQHFFVEDEGTLIDIPGDQIAVAGVPVPPKGLEVDRIDVVVRVKRSF